jgi:outer membrane immunogenic protein
MMKRYVLVAIATLGMPVAAMAGGVAAPVIEPTIAQPAPVVAVAPNGDWTGFYAGASLGFGKFTASGAADGNDMGIAGVNLGYRRDFGRLVVGGELSYAKDDLGVSTGNTIDNSTALQLMVGSDMGRTLVYVAAGAVRSDATLAGVKGTDNGYFGGIGVDYALNDRWTVGGEVLSTRYNDFDSTGIDLNATTLQLKVGMRF